MSREDYARRISADYHKLVDGKSGEEKASNLKEVREWAASQESVIDEELPLKSVTTHITSISTSGSQSSPTISSNIMVSGLLLIARILDWVVRAIFLGLGLL